MKPLEEGQIAVQQIEDYNTSFYYWTRNKYCSYIKFRFKDERIGIRATITKFMDDIFIWHVQAPDWYVSDTWQGKSATLELAKIEANKWLAVLIKAEFSEEDNRSR